MCGCVCALWSDRALPTTKKAAASKARSYLFAFALSLGGIADILEPRPFRGLCFDDVSASVGDTATEADVRAAPAPDAGNLGIFAFGGAFVVSRGDIAALLFRMPDFLFGDCLSLSLLAALLGIGSDALLSTTPL